MYQFFNFEICCYVKPDLLYRFFKFIYYLLYQFFNFEICCYVKPDFEIYCYRFSQLCGFISANLLDFQSIRFLFSELWIRNHEDFVIGGVCYRFRYRFSQLQISFRFIVWVFQLIGGVCCFWTLNSKSWRFDNHGRWRKSNWDEGRGEGWIGRCKDESADVTGICLLSIWIC